ncbi:MAG: MBL fold metallo-hydrolase [Thermodesulfobacteriota bacterium]
MLSKIIIPPHPPNYETPILLAEKDDHAVYWLGAQEATAFRSNSYLILDNNESLLIDPGNRSSFPVIKNQVENVCNIRSLKGLILCHQDPDVAASAVDWLKLLPELPIISSPRCNVLLPHYGMKDYNFHDIEAKQHHVFSSGRTLSFITAPFLHSPMAFTTYDEECHLLFSGDIFAALDTEWKMVVENFQDHIPKMELFHTDYMASNIASRGFVNKIEDLPISMILPQHGSIIPEEFVEDALNYLINLQCGTDLLYPELI